jgi:type I restriction enzyme S subunit
MNQEIKERVEIIQNGEVPEGYKETEAGIIPDDLDVVKAKMGQFPEELGI